MINNQTCLPTTILLGLTFCSKTASFHMTIGSEAVEVAVAAVDIVAVVVGKPRQIVVYIDAADSCWRYCRIEHHAVVGKLLLIGMVNKLLVLL